MIDFCQIVWEFYWKIFKKTLSIYNLFRDHKVKPLYIILYIIIDSAYDNITFDFITLFEENNILNDQTHCLFTIIYFTR